MTARTMRVCTVCSERWDTAEDGGGDYRWVVCCKKKNKKTKTYRGHHKQRKKQKIQNKIVVPCFELANYYRIV